MNIYKRIEEKKKENKINYIILTCVCVIYIIATNI